MKSIILASKSEVRKKILDDNKIKCSVEPSNLDEDEVKKSLLNQGANPELISKNLAELKANKVSQKNLGEIVLGADSVIDLEDKLVSKPTNRIEAMNILNLLNGKSHFLISSVCISLDGKMIWNYTEKAEMIMKNFEETPTYAEGELRNRRNPSRKPKTKKTVWCNVRCPLPAGPGPPVEENKTRDNRF